MRGNVNGKQRGEARVQLTTEESNHSQFVTKVRWVVQSVHGIVGRKFKLLHTQVDNKFLPKVGAHGTYCLLSPEPFQPAFTI